MLNKEKYHNKIFKIACDGGKCALKDKEPVNCNEIECKECDFDMGDGECRKRWSEWCNSEYVDPTVDWSKVPIDTPILVRDSEEGTWHPRYFAFFTDNSIYAFTRGTTSWAIKDIRENVMEWNYAKIATEEEIENSKNEFLKMAGKLRFREWKK